MASPAHRADDEFLDAVRRGAGGATVMDPEAVAAQIAAPGPRSDLELPTSRESEVLAVLEHLHS